jgi:serine protease SohB
MRQFLADYGLFLAKTATLVVALLAVAAGLSAAVRRRHQPDRIEVTKLNDEIEHARDVLRSQILQKKEWKKLAKERKRQHKREAKAATSGRKRMYVLDFHGDIKATAVAALREEITAVLTVATPQDEVLVLLENAGGLVHDHGLAASQLARLRERGIPLTAAVDKIAASGGYMMACVADKIVAAPFAVLGSIGVLAQLPNFHEMLARHGIRFEQESAGTHKRNVTMFGANTEKEREMLRQELEETHLLFKQFVARYRPQLDIERLSTGEHWYGTRALELKLADAIQTSDDYLLQAAETTDLFNVTCTPRQGLVDRLFAALHARLGII